MNEVCASLLSRRTIRRFRAGPLPADSLQLVLRCGAMAASAGNRQPCEFVLVDDPPTVDRLTGLLRWFGGEPQGPQRPAAHVVIVLRLPDPRWTTYADAGAAAQNMLVAAWSMGIGACWFGSLHAEKVRDLLAVPAEGAHVFGVLSFGLVGESPVAEPMQSEPPRICRDEQGVLHVQKRPLGGICHHNRYGAPPPWACAEERPPGP